MPNKSNVTEANEQGGEEQLPPEEEKWLPPKKLEQVAKYQDDLTDEKIKQLGKYNNK